MEITHGTTTINLHNASRDELCDAIEFFELKAELYNSVPVALRTPLTISLIEETSHIMESIDAAGATLMAQIKAYA